MLVAPTELKHAAFRALATNGRGSMRPEEMGADFAFNYKGRWYGVQRKEIKDLIASVNDGRLAKEMQQMVALEQGLLVVEGSPKWSLDGAWLGDKWGASWSRQQHTSMLLSVQQAGVWVLGSSDTSDTARLILDYERWVKKGTHTALLKRGPMMNPWGTKDNRDYQLHLIMGLPDVGYTLAVRLLDTLGMPFGLRVTMADLMSVEGIGRKKAEKILLALGGVQ